MSSFVTTFLRRFTAPNFCVHCIPSVKWYSLHFFVFVFFCVCSLASIIDDSNDASIPTHEEDEMETSVISQALNKVNPLYATILGQPFEGQGIDMSLDRWVLNITVSGRSMGGSWGVCSPPPLFWKKKKEEMTKGKKASGASKSRPSPLPPLSSRSGSTTDCQYLL